MDFDSPWKEALEVYFQAFLALFFPDIHGDIDWSRGFEFLDKDWLTSRRWRRATNRTADERGRRGWCAGCASEVSAARTCGSCSG